MDERERGKIKRYFKNSERFLWGLGPGNQESTYKWLKDQGFNISRRGTYSQVILELLEKNGVEKILEDAVVPRVKELFVPGGKLDFLRDCWEKGILPKKERLRELGLIFDTRHPVPAWRIQNKAYPFLVFNSQYEYVERWGDFAGVWFEEIEPLLGERL